MRRGALVPTLRLGHTPGASSLALHTAHRRVGACGPARGHSQHSSMPLYAPLCFYRRRILTFPRGNQRKSCLALYLDAPESSLLPPFMCPTATFTFTLVNQLDESKSWSKSAYSRVS